MALFPAANLLVDYNCQRLKVADFGCAELLDECCRGSSFPDNKDAGTLWYNPPEVSYLPPHLCAEENYRWCTKSLL